MTTTAATERQTSYLRHLLALRSVVGESAFGWMAPDGIDSLTKSEASAYIDALVESWSYYYPHISLEAAAASHLRMAEEYTP